MASQHGQLISNCTFHTRVSQSVVDLTVSPVKTSEDEEQLERLALLLHVLAAYCETQKPVELTKIQKILLSLLVLYADNREELYHSALNEAVRAVMEVLPEEGWRPAREYVASRLSCTCRFFLSFFLLPFRNCQAPEKRVNKTRFQGQYQLFPESRGPILRVSDFLKSQVLKTFLA